MMFNRIKLFTRKGISYRLEITKTAICPYCGAEYECDCGDEAIKCWTCKKWFKYYKRQREVIKIPDPS